MVVKFNDKLFPAIERQAQKAVEKAGDVYKDKVGDLIFGPKSGQTYVRGPKTLDGGMAGQFTFDTGTRIHKASAPGEPFANDYGAWWGLFDKIVKKHSVKLSTGVDYAMALEFGTSKMAARPTLRPAIGLSAQEIVKTFETELLKALK